MYINLSSGAGAVKLNQGVVISYIYILFFGRPYGLRKLKTTKNPKIINAL
jgi:hypothetical protein